MCVTPLLRGTIDVVLSHDHATYRKEEEERKHNLSTCHFVPHLSGRQLRLPPCVTPLLVEYGGSLVRYKLTTPCLQ